MKQTLSLLLLLNIFLNFSGVQCQSFSPPTEDICLGESITYTYTCVVVNSEPMFTTSWRLTPDGGEPRCIVQHNDPDSMDACGPGRVFTSSLTDQSGDNTTFTSTLSVGSISESLNRTRVECLDAGLETVGSKGICIVGGEVVPPEFLPASISEPDVGVDECVLSVRWSEPVISCAGSVSQYVLSVTPPTSDCQSGAEGCVFMTNQTQYNLNVTASQTYNLTVRANDSCGNMGQPAKYDIDLTAQARVQGNCSYSYMYDPTTSKIESLKVQWPRFKILGTEADYKVVIIPQSGDDMVCGDNVTCNCTDDDYCSYFFKSISINDSYSAAVKVVGCVTEMITCDNVSSRCNIIDLQVPLPSNGNWTGLSNEAGFRFEGGNVTYNGISEGSVATYTTFGSYLVNGSQTFNTTCRNDEWDRLPNISVTIDDDDDDDEGVLAVWNIPLIGIGAVAYIIAVIIAVILGTLLFLRASNTIDLVLAVTILASAVIALPVVPIVYFVMKKKGDVREGALKGWYKIYLVVGAVLNSMVTLIMWLVLLGYTVSQGDDIDAGTRNGLVNACFIMSLLLLLEWSIRAILWTRGVRGTDATDSPPPKPCRCKKSKSKQAEEERAEEEQELDAYDTLNHGKQSSSPQPLLSDTDPAYGKLNPKQDDQHYGKLDHGIKKKGVTLPPSSEEYGKLEPQGGQHYGKLVHGTKKGVTLPGAVPPGGEEYGKLDQSQVGAHGGRGVDLYTEVTNEPRHKPRKPVE